MASAQMSIRTSKEVLSCAACDRTTDSISPIEDGCRGDESSYRVQEKLIRWFPPIVFEVLILCSIRKKYKNRKR